MHTLLRTFSLIAALTLSARALTPADLNPAAYATEVDGVTTPLAGTARETLPEWIVWTDKSQPGHSLVKFGETKSLGPRHLRIGFKTPLPIGSVLVRGGGSLSVLREGAAESGDLTRDADWLPAQRLLNGELSTAEASPEDLALWTLPPGTKTRALRFTHTPAAADSAYYGQVGALSILPERVVNVAPLATASVSAQTQLAAKINDGSNDQTWKIWANRDQQATEGPVVSPDHPEWIVLTWPAPVKLAGLEALAAGFGSARAQIYTGPADRHPREAAESDWKTVGSYSGLKNGYPISLWPSPLPFPEPVTTRAIRLQLLTPTEESHPHLKGHTAGSRRVWLGELMAFQPLGNQPLQAIHFAAPAGEPHAPLPIRFQLEKPGFVTLVIEDSTGQRVRNFVSETPFPAGENTAWWDGTDDLGRDLDAARHGLYHIPAQFVAPGSYRVRGLVRGEITPRYEFAVYNSGNPPWPTSDGTGAWLANHTPPQAALFVPGEKPAIYLGSYVSEGRDGLAWVDLDGHKLGGERWVGGNWTGAPYLARDEGAKAVSGTFAYAASVWQTGKGSDRAELRLTALTGKGDQPVLRYEFAPQDPKQMQEEISGLAVRDGRLVVSLPRQKVLLLAEAATGKVTGTAPLEDPRGLAFDSQGHLLALAGRNLLRYPRAESPLPSAEPLVTGLDDPQQLTLDSAGNIYVSEGGQSHQVKVFSPTGKPLRAIGHPGAPKAGPYDPLHLNNPAGLAIDSRGHLWVTEKDYLPKRVSVWTLDGKLVQAFYGPGKYGGGGTLDSQDRSRFYYSEEEHGAMEFRLDWAKGESHLSSVYYRPGENDLPLAFRSAGPETALYREGRRYFTNCYNSSPTGGHGTAFLFLERDGVAHPVAAMGRASDWPQLPLPATAKPKDPLFFAWSDTNADGKVQADEVAWLSAASGGVTVMPDLSFCIARVGDKTLRYVPAAFSAQGIPRYDLAHGETLLENVQPPASSGGDQLLAEGGKTVLTLGSGPFHRYSLTGPGWSYPNPWPGLHASHEAPPPEFPGQVIGATRLLGGYFTPKGSAVGPLWGVNANMGNLYLFTADGLFVATIFSDVRHGKLLSMPAAPREMDLAGVTLHDENFWPTVSQTPEGQVYLVDGSNLALVRLDGLETLRPLPAQNLTVTPADLQKAQGYLLAREAARQREQGRGTLEARLLPAGPVDWSQAQWVEIDKRGVAANFNSKSKPYDVTAALAIAGDRLCARWRTGDDKLLQNSSELPNAPFKTGGALDLMLATDPKAPAARTAAAPGDLRLLVTQVKGQPSALLYRPVVPGTKDPVPFSSPSRTITLDRVDDVTAEVRLTAKDGDYEISVPLKLLGLAPTPGATLHGDLGILRGDGRETTARIYWSNKATGITADVPSEAQLTPQLWGPIRLVSPASP